MGHCEVSRRSGKMARCTEEFSLAPSPKILSASRVRPRWRVLAAVFALAVASCASGPRVEPRPATASATLIAAAQSQSNAAAAINSPYGNYLAGLIAGQQRDLSAAADFMLLALESDPENPRLLRRTFMLVAGDGRYDLALDLARRLMAVDPKDGTAPLLLAAEAFKNGNAEAAGAMLAGLPERGLSTIIAPMLAGWGRLAQGDIEAGLERLALLRKSKGFDLIYYLQVALMYDVAGRPSDAEGAYQKALDEAKGPSLRQTLLTGNFFERRGLAERAAEVYQNYLKENPASGLLDHALARLESGARPAPLVATVQQGWAEVYFNMASLLNQEQASEVALIHAHLALLLEPRLEVVQVLLGEILEGQDRGEEAIAAYRRIDRDSPFAWTARLRVAELLDRNDRSEEAIMELEALAAERPANHESLLRVGNLLRNQERFAEAVVAYDRAFERLKASEALPWSMYYFRGIALERSDQWDRAESDFLAALDLEPEQPYVMNYLAYSWIEQERHFERAKKMLMRAVELRPNDGFIIDSLGWVYYRLEEFDKGVTQLERAVELRPQDPVINDHLGDAYWQVGRRQEARFQWRRSLSLGPEEDLVPEIEAKIKRGLIVEPRKI